MVNYNNQIKANIKQKIYLKFIFCKRNLKLKITTEIFLNYESKTKLFTG